jgi:hypothetical protein
MIFVAEEYDARASLQASYTPASQHIKCTFNGRREVQPSHFSKKLKTVLNVCKAGRAKSHACAQALHKFSLKWL